MATILITGCAGEVGSSLATYLSEQGSHRLIGLDLRELPGLHKSRFTASYAGSISDPTFVEQIGLRHDIDQVYHLAGVLSSGGERNPTLAHDVNVTGTLNVLELARRATEKSDVPVKVVFTSTIAVYGLPNLEVKASQSCVSEDDFLKPVTMYGANKLYCESLGSYYADHYGLLNTSSNRARIDFRCLRYPGLLNAHTLPTGGTSDYAPEMVHALARGLAYECFVREDSRIPFMMMPDALSALVQLGEASADRLSRRVYNVAGFSPSAGEIAEYLQTSLSSAPVTYKPHPARQFIVDSWPEAVADDAARTDWNWKPNYSFESGMSEYLIPQVKAHYELPKAANS